MNTLELIKLGAAILGGTAVLGAIVYLVAPCALKHHWGGWGEWYRVRYIIPYQVRYRVCRECGAKQRQEREL